MQFPVPNYNHPHSEGKINDTNLLGILFNFDKGKMLAIRKSKGVGRPPKKNSLVICSLVLKIIIWVQAEKTSELVVILICKGNHFSCIWCVPSDILLGGGRGRWRESLWLTVLVATSRHVVSLGTFFVAGLSQPKERKKDRRIIVRVGWRKET